MKKISSIFLLIISSAIHAQFSDLGTLSEGTLSNFQNILDNEDHLFGYLAIYQLDNSNKDVKNFEYVFLDKNLNTVSSQEFESNSLAKNYYGYIADNGEFILRPHFEVYKRKDLKNKFPPVYVIDMKNNTLTEKVYYCFENESLKICEDDENNILDNYKEARKERKKDGFEHISQVRQLKDGNFIVYDYYSNGKSKYDAYNSDNRFQKFDKNLNKIWEFNFNSNASKTASEAYYLIDWEDDRAYFLKQYQFKKHYTYYFVVMDLENGEILFDENINTPYPDFTQGNITYFDIRGIKNYYNGQNFFEVVGYYFNKNKDVGFLDFYYDKNRNKLQIKKLTFEAINKITDEIEIIPGSELKGEPYELIVKDMYFLEDGSVGILTEKSKLKTAKIVTTDMVLLTTNKDFQPNEVIVFEKDKSKTLYANDYLFSQYINDGKDVVFFYKDYQKDKQTKDKNWVLYINTIIDGKFKQEQIPISSENNYIYPALAKEGYILLREFNVDDKYDQIRLERLNY